jgi:hypothetical protein
MLSVPIYWCSLVSSTNILVQYKENQSVSSTAPIWLNNAYSICRSGAETEMHVFKMAANFRGKITSITTIGAKTQAFAIFPTPPYFSLPTTFKSSIFENF